MVSFRSVSLSNALFRINCGGANYTDRAGLAWTADANFTGGAATSFAVTWAGTQDQTLYNSVRLGADFRYTFSGLANGKYLVQVGLNGANASAGSDEWLHQINGATVADFDPAAIVTGPNVTTLTYAATVAAGSLIFRVQDAAQGGSPDTPTLAWFALIPLF